MYVYGSIHTYTHIYIYMYTHTLHIAQNNWVLQVKNCTGGSGKYFLAC